MHGEGRGATQFEPERGATQSEPERERGATQSEPEREQGARPSQFTIHNSQFTIHHSRISPLHRVFLLLTLLLAFALRLHRLGAESLWYDETVSVHLARLPVAAMLAHTAGDIHPPGYYLLLHGWQWLTQPSLAHGLEFLFAWPSLWFGMVTVALIYALGRRLLSSPAALLAVLFAALDPFQLWYSQEVRMYTLGAALGLLCLWATIQAFSKPQRRPWLIVYALAAAAGLYTLYYFAFLLIALNVVALYLWGRGARGEGRGARGEAPNFTIHNSQFTIHNLRGEGRGARGEGRGARGEGRGARGEGRGAILAWLLTQLAVLLLFLPWLPIFHRQATDPPVPPWRTPWPDLASLVASKFEALAAFLVGQSPPLDATWPWALLVIGLSIAFAIRQWRRAGLALLLYMAVPLALILGLTLLVTPIYHVRYLSFVAAPFALVSASAVVDLWGWRRGAGAALAGLLLLAMSASLAAFWTNPRYAADDHRGAVAALAARWRPGDVILANAGWVYPVLLTYWPDESAASAPPPIQQVARLGDALTAGDAPIIVRTGSVDGAPDLGWGNPASDFFAMSSAATTAALTDLAATHPRLWHYRLYDTVSDPDGILRAWLGANTDLRGEWQIPGRDYGLVQLFASRSTTSTVVPAAWRADGAIFGDALRLAAVAAPKDHPAGQHFYVNLQWEPLPALADLPADLSMSLRLYDGAGSLVAQQDEPPATPTRSWSAGLPQVQALALPVPGATPPGVYSLELVVYRQDNGEPLAVPENERSVFGQRYRLGSVEIRGG
jgi:hypothetical protein